jgi:hypothetical protein
MRLRKKDLAGILAATGEEQKYVPRNNPTPTL